jgi:hypothetical protein
MSAGQRYYRKIEGTSALIDETNILLNLPWKIQVALASGYAAYLLGYRGVRAAHKAIDTAFITLVFGLVATSVIVLLAGQNIVVITASAFAASCVSAILWRMIFSQWLHGVMHHFNISWSNDDPSALATLSNNTKYPLTQIAVELDDGTWLRCDDTSKYIGAPFGPVVLGPNGDIAFYLTHQELLGADAKQLTSVRDPNYGDRITYIPAHRINRITFRHKQKTSRLSKAEVSQHSGSAQPSAESSLEASVDMISPNSLP